MIGDLLLVMIILFIPFLDMSGEPQKTCFSVPEDDAPTEEVDANQQSVNFVMSLELDEEGDYPPDTIPHVPDPSASFIIDKFGLPPDTTQDNLWDVVGEEIQKEVAFKLNAVVNKVEEELKKQNLDVQEEFKQNVMDAEAIMKQELTEKREQCRICDKFLCPEDKRKHDEANVSKYNQPKEMGIISHGVCCQCCLCGPINAHNEKRVYTEEDLNIHRELCTDENCPYVAECPCCCQLVTTEEKEAHDKAYKQKIKKKKKDPQDKDFDGDFTASHLQWCDDENCPHKKTKNKERRPTRQVIGQPTKNPQ